MGSGAIKAKCSKAGLRIMMVLLLLAGLRNGGGQTPARQQGEVDVPEGTPVVFHLYGGPKPFDSAGMDVASKKKSETFHALIQVDQDVVVDGVVVVPRGSLGQISVEARAGRLPLQLLARGLVGFSMTPEFVFSRASTQVAFNGKAIELDLRRKNLENPEDGISPIFYAEYTGKLKQVTLAAR
jgi:hypothetical protein